MTRNSTYKIYRREKHAETLCYPRNRPTRGRLRERIAALADKGAISFSAPAFDVRAKQRAIDINDARQVLKYGMIDGAIVAGRDPDEWKCKMIRKAERAARWIGVVTVVIRDERLFVLTVDWEDR